MAVSTKPIPEGFRSVTPHMVLRHAADAIEFYKHAFGAEEICRMPMPGDSKKLMHAAIRIGDSIIMMADEFPGCGGNHASPQTYGGSTVSIHLYVPDVDVAMARAVKAGAKVTMPQMDMFWGDRYGQVVDPFGHNWSLATHVRDLTPEEIAKGAEECMAQMAAAAPQAS